MKMTHITKPFGWKRNLDFLKINFFMMYKTMLEYKISSWSGIISQTMFLIANFIFFYMIANNFGNTINWTLEDFLLMILIIDTMFNIEGLFTWKIGLNYYIQKGDFNQLIPRPLSKFLLYNGSKISPVAFLMVIMNLIIIPIFLIITQIELQNIFLSLILFIGIFIFRISWKFLYSSTSFISYGFNQFIYNVDETVRKFGRNYNYQFFNNSKFQIVLNFIAVFYISSILVPVLRNYEITYLKEQIIFICVLTPIFVMGIACMWKYGLKTYSAYG